MRRLVSWWRLRRQDAVEAEIVTLALVLAERTEERDKARREVDELAAAVDEQARLRANAETALACAVERARQADQRARIAEQVLRRHDERDAQLRRAEVERTGGR